MPILFTEATKEDFGPGQWRKPDNFEKRKQRLRFKAVIICPECERERAIGPKHDIDLNGVVKPSMVCGVGNHKCSFHDFIKLEGWVE